MKYFMLMIPVNENKMQLLILMKQKVQKSEAMDI